MCRLNKSYNFIYKDEFGYNLLLSNFYLNVVSIIKDRNNFVDKVLKIFVVVKCGKMCIKFMCD